MTLVDDPTVAGAYGGFRFDDAGEPAAAVPLIDRGKLVGRIARELRRRAHRACSSRRRRTCGSRPGSSESALALESRLLARGPSRRARRSGERPRRDRGAARARDRSTASAPGGCTPTSSSSAISRRCSPRSRDATKATRVIGLRDERDGLPRWRSIEAPWLRARGLVRARRSAGVIDRRSLVRALGHEDLADWVVIQRDQELAVDRRRRRSAPSSARAGSSRSTPTRRRAAAPRISRSMRTRQIPTSSSREAAIARAAVGRSGVGDDSTGGTRAGRARRSGARDRRASRGRGDDREAGAAQTGRDDRRAGERSCARASACRRARASTPSGSATLARVEALVTQGAHGLAIAREARRGDRARRRRGDRRRDRGSAAARERAVPYSPGRARWSSTADALLHGGLGVWDAFVTQADPVVARQGLTRYHEPAAIAAGAENVAEPLSIASDGALAFGVQVLAARRRGRCGAQVPARRRAGIAAGLGLTPREAALRQRDPNGGVRNLIVDAGSWDERSRAGSDPRDRGPPAARPRDRSVHRRRGSRARARGRSRDRRAVLGRHAAPRSDRRAREGQAQCTDDPARAVRRSCRRPDRSRRLDLTSARGRGSGPRLPSSRRLPSSCAESRCP